MSARLIKFYKGVVLNKIHTHVGNEFTIEELDVFLKDYADVEGSTTKMSLEDLKTLVEWSLYFANSIGLDLDYPADKLDEQINLKLGTDIKPHQEVGKTNHK